MTRGAYTKRVALTLVTNILSLLVAIGSSVILARILGPKGKGIYQISYLVPSLIVTLGNFGVGPATTYFVARRTFPKKAILGTNAILTGILSFSGIVLGTILITTLSSSLLKGVPREFLLLALMLIPFEIGFANFQSILLGLQKIREYNYASIAQSVMFLAFLTVALLVFRAGVAGALVAIILAWAINTLLVFRRAYISTGGMQLSLDREHIKQLVSFGLKAHLANILGFLNYRVDMFLVNFYLGPAWVGQYSIGVALAEKLWLVAGSASTVLYPRVAATANEEERARFTSLVARVVLLVTTVGALALVLVARPAILLLYSSRYLPSVDAFRALLVGIIALSGGKILSNDIAGRGYPQYNVIIGTAAIICNLVLNIFWIPRYGIAGAAWASTVSYTLQFCGSLIVFRMLANTSLSEVVFVRREDLALLFNAVRSALRHS